MERTEAEHAIEVEISDTQGHLHVDPAEVAALVRVVLTAERRRHASISIAIVDQAAIHAINRSHLGHDWPTDVISFPLSEPTDDILAGELVISGEMAATTAAEFGADPRDELALYIVHGLLHLCGYDDLSEGDASAMRRREGELLAACGRPNPFELGGRSTVDRRSPDGADSYTETGRDRVVGAGSVPRPAGPSPDGAGSYTETDRGLFVGGGSVPRPADTLTHQSEPLPWSS
jgi:probable rRNA maturation factor